MNSKLLMTIIVSCNISLACASEISLNILSNPELDPSHVSQVKSIQLPLVEITPEIQQAMSKQISSPLRQIKSQGLESKKELGMGNVPVLDQGQHGSCATFAITASLDALDNLGNRYSQLCFLQLGNYLFQNGQGSSGWDGLSGPTAFKRIDSYGLMSIKQERNYGCGGLKAYPTNSAHSGEMSVENYTKYAKVPAYDHQLIFSLNQDKIKAIKQSIDANHRVVFGILLPKADMGTAGAIGWHHYFNDTWVLSDAIKDEIANHPSVFPAHMMVITGYDDKASARDYAGKLHKGLFTVRNSWGSYVGDWGTFYISYDYIMSLAIVAYEIKH